MSQKLEFTILKKQGNARVWRIRLNGKELLTPIFMPVGTKATIKGIILDLLRDRKYIGNLPPINLILANTFHLYLRPWDKLIHDFWWLHQFQHRDQLILTDSGWFQVFSLGLSKKTPGKSLIKLREEGIYFRSPYDGSPHFFSPENVVDIQRNLWSDIMMVLDVCSPPWLTKKKFHNQMLQTHRRATRAFDHFEQHYHQSRGVLFPIVQWGLYEDLREESVKFLSQYARDGIAVWGVSVGEAKEDIQRIVSFTWPKLPENKPHYLMGVGTPEDITHAIEQGFDMFDCVLATRLGRHGTAFSDHGNIKLSNAQYKNSQDKLTSNCPCYTCQHFTKGYLHHLVKEDEMLGWTLLSLHNIVYLHNMVNTIQQRILNS